MDLDALMKPLMGSQEGSGSQAQTTFLSVFLPKVQAWIMCVCVCVSLSVCLSLSQHQPLVIWVTLPPVSIMQWAHDRALHGMWHLVPLWLLSQPGRAFQPHI